MNSFNPAQLKRASEVCADLGKVLLVASVSGLIVPPVGRTVPLLVPLVGGFLGGYLIGLSIKFLEGVKENDRT